MRANCKHCGGRMFVDKYQIISTEIWIYCEKCKKKEVIKLPVKLSELNKFEEKL